MKDKKTSIRSLNAESTPEQFREVFAFRALELEDNNSFLQGLINHFRQYKNFYLGLERSQFLGDENRIYGVVLFPELAKNKTYLNVVAAAIIDRAEIHSESVAERLLANPRIRIELKKNESIMARLHEYARELIAHYPSFAKAAKEAFQKTHPHPWKSAEPSNNAKDQREKREKRLAGSSDTESSEGPSSQSTTPRFIRPKGG